MGKAVRIKAVVNGDWRTVGRKEAPNEATSPILPDSLKVGMLTLVRSDSWRSK
jgi:hypothetical protein